MANDLVPVNAAPEDALPIMWKFAQRIADTEFVPQAFRRRPEAVLAAIQFGRELGIGPMQSLQSIDVIQGKPTLSAEAMRARVFAAGHTISTETLSERECVLVGKRADGTTAQVTFTWADAERAGLTGKDSWKKYPSDMLLARCSSKLCRLLFPDVLSSISYVAEELGGEPETENAPDIAEPIANADVPDGAPFSDVNLTAMQPAVPRLIEDAEVISDHSVSTSESDSEGSPIDGSDPATPAVELDTTPDPPPAPTVPVEPPLTPSLADTAVSATRVHDLRVRIGALQAKRTKGVNVFVPRVKNGMPLSEYADIEAKVAALEGVEHP